jgi:hypothetical protein
MIALQRKEELKRSEEVKEGIDRKEREKQQPAGLEPKPKAFTKQNSMRFVSLVSSL